MEGVLAAAKREGLLLDAATAKVSEAGLDFYAVFARDDQGTEWVVRSPRRAEVVERARHEARVLAFVRPRLPVAVPDWRIHTDDLIAYPKLGGSPAGEIDPEAMAYVWKVDPQALKPAFFASTGKALAALHGASLEDVAKAGFAVPDMAGVRAKVASQMEQVRREIGVPDVLWKRWQTWLEADELWPKEPSFIHGDFHAGHMLVDEDERLVGLLDWTEGEVADRTVDLAGFQMVFGVAAMGPLLDAYVAAGGRVWPKLKEQIAETLAAFPYKVGLFALASGKDEHLAMAKSALGIT
jgi:macrolide phosphotransferase